MSVLRTVGAERLKLSGQVLLPSAHQPADHANQSGIHCVGRVLRQATERSTSLPTLEACHAMNVRPTSSVFQRLTRRIGGSGRRLHYVTDDAQWAFYWVAKYIATSISTQTEIDARVIRKPWRLSGQIVHFVDRYRFLERSAHRLAEKNDLFLTWFHGQRDDPAMSPYFEKLLAAQGHVRRIVTTCSPSATELQAAGIGPRRIEIIPLGVDLRLFVSADSQRKQHVRRCLGIPGDAVVVGSFQKDGVGWQDGIEPKWGKGPDVFLDVIAKLAASHPKLFILLTGPARGFVKQGLRRIGVPFVHNYLNNYRDLVPYYQALDLYVIASRCEGGPQALLESWACGVPLVSTRMGMPADLIRDRENGGLAEVDDVETLRERARELLDHADLRENCRRQALDEVRQFDWDVIAKRYYQQLYAPLVETRHAA